MSQNSSNNAAQSESKQMNALEKAKHSKQQQAKKKQDKQNKPQFFKRLANKFSDLNTTILVLYGVLVSVGLIMVQTASSYLATSADLPIYYYLLRQAIFAVLGIVVVIILYFMNTEMWRSKPIQRLIYFGITALLALTVVIGEEINGAQGWIGYGPFSIQPVEFAKPALVILVANFLARPQVQRDLANDFKLTTFLQKYWKQTLAIGIWIGMIVSFPDLGGVLILGALLVIMLFSSGVPLKWFFRVLIFVVGIYLLVYIGLNFIDLTHIDNYQVERLTSFINPFADAQDTGMQLVNSYYALANGGLFGLGAGNSIQKLGYLPEAHNDFIMAIVGEEFGLLGILAILLIYFILVVYIFYKAKSVRHTFDQLVLIGVGAYFLIQAFVNIGGIIGLIPLTGVTFPFMSYGGSSLLVTSSMIGIALSILRNDEKAKRKIQARKQTQSNPQNTVEASN